jgi:hypothetical protein
MEFDEYKKSVKERDNQNSKRSLGKALEERDNTVEEKEIGRVNSEPEWEAQLRGKNPMVRSAPV